MNQRPFASRWILLTAVMLAQTPGFGMARFSALPAPRPEMRRAPLILTIHRPILQAKPVVRDFTQVFLAAVRAAA